MLNYKALEHSDDFETVVVCWVEVTGVPERFVEEAGKIDGENYIGDGFGVCIQYDRDSGEYYAIEAEPGYNLYYVDNKGEKHWLPYEVNEQEVELLSQNILPEIEKEMEHESGRAR